MTETTLTFDVPWTINLQCESSPVTHHAAEELSDVLGRITGHTVVVGEGSDRCIVLQYDHLADDGFAWKVTPERVILHGHNARGLLNAVYAFLEALGCRWPYPGVEMLPDRTRFSVPTRLETTPALPGRCLILGHNVFVSEAPQWVEWASHNFYNTIFIHALESPDNPLGLALGAAQPGVWEAIREETLAAIRQHSMTLEYGGHKLEDLLPRRRFDSMPEAFRHDGERRNPDHNLCPSNEDGMNIVRQGAAEHFRRHPYVDVFHVWPADIPGGGWCRCERCAGLSPSDQSLLVMNALADVLAEVSPSATLAYLSYHDTEVPPQGIAPRPNVFMLWAPRRRCYGHSLDNADCAVNREFVHLLRANVGYFAGAGAAPARVFEYYLDGILFKSLAPPLGRVMQADLRAYRDVGVHTVQALMTGDRPWLSPPLDLWLFPRLAWNPDQDSAALRDRFLEAWLGEEAPLARDVYEALEKAMALVLTFEPGEGEPPALSSDMLDNPPADMLDPIYAPRALMARRAGAFEQAQAILDAVRLPPGQTHPHRMMALHAEFELAVHSVRYMAARHRAYLDGLEEDVSRACVALNAIRRWARRHIPDPVMRANFNLLHLSWELHIEALRYRRANRLLRTWLLIRAYLRPMWPVLRLRLAQRGMGR
jgi:hypothetical protein